MPDARTIEEHLFADDGRVPNNPSLPLIVYRSALETGPRCAGDCEKLFADNGWSGGWRNGIYAPTIITAPRTRCSASRPDRFACDSAARTAQR
jgi:hypothetical protein